VVAPTPVPVKAGDRVIVEGLQKARPGSPVKVTAVKIEEFDRPAAAGAESTAPAAAAH